MKKIHREDAAENNAVDDKISALSLCERGEELYESEKIRESIKAFDKALEMDSKLVPGWIGRGDCLQELEKFEEAVESYDKALKLDSENAWAWSERGCCLQELDKLEDALKSFDKALKIDSELVPAWIDRGDCLQELVRYEEALESYDKALEMDPEIAWAWSGRGCCLQELDKLDEAMKSFDKALKIDSEFVPAWAGKGDCLQELEKYEEALESYGKALEIDPEDEWSLNERAVCLKELNQLGGEINEAANSLDEPKDKIREIKKPGWLYIVNSSAEANKREIDLEFAKPNHGNIGKYLFFSDDKGILIKLAKKIMVKYELFNAKVPLSDTPNPSPGFGFVLCIYDVSPRFKQELRQFADEKTIKYRYWKSDSSTIRGEYSEEFISSREKPVNRVTRLKLEIDLVPKTAWYSNLRKQVPRKEWDKIRKKSYSDAGNKCSICSAPGKLNCHELWEYDEDKHIQKLKGFIALCDDCHMIKHVGYAGIKALEGQLDMEKLIKHFMKVNGVDRKTYEEHHKLSLELWRYRSQHPWKTDLGEWSNLVEDPNHNQSNEGRKGGN